MSEVYVMVRATGNFCHKIQKEENKRKCIANGIIPNSKGEVKVVILGTNGFEVQKINKFPEEVWKVLLDEAGCCITPKIGKTYIVSYDKSYIVKANKSEEFSQNLNKTNPLQAKEVKIESNMKDNVKETIDFINGLNEELNEETKEEIKNNKNTVVIESQESFKVLEKEKEKRNKKQLKKIYK